MECELMQDVMEDNGKFEMKCPGELVELFLSHQLDGTILKDDDGVMDDDSSLLCNSLLSALQHYDLKDAFSTRLAHHIPYQVLAKDIPQYSDIDRCFIKVPYLLANCGLEKVDFLQMGYMLRCKKRSVVADKKYGENQAKTAAQAGLCIVDRNGIRLTKFGRHYSLLADDQKRKIYGYLSLYIPMIQNCVCSSDCDVEKQQYLSILSESTQKRRLPNINRLISIVQDGVQGY